MRWNKKHSANAVAAKARLRMAQSEVIVEPAGKVYLPRKRKPDFTIRIESKTGERVQVSAWRFYNRVILSGGFKSVRSLCRGIEHLITKSAIGA